MTYSLTSGIHVGELERPKGERQLDKAPREPDASKMWFLDFGDSRAEPTPAVGDRLFFRLSYIYTKKKKSTGVVCRVSGYKKKHRHAELRRRKKKKGSAPRPKNNRPERDLVKRHRCVHPPPSANQRCFPTMLSSKRQTASRAPNSYGSSINVSIRNKPFHEKCDSLPELVFRFSQIGDR